MTSARFSAGIHAVARLLEEDPGRVRRLLVDRRVDNERIRGLLESAGAAGVAVERVARNRLDALAAGTRHQGVVAELRGASSLDEAALRTLVETRLTAGETLLLLVLDGVQDPHNLGACLRTADAAGVDAVVIPRRHAAGITPAVRKVATGAAESVPLARVERLPRVIDWLHDYGVRVIGTADGAEAGLYDTDLTGPVALVLGGEERGMAAAVAERCDAVIAIPMAGSVESLNVSVAAGVCLYEACRQRRSIASEPGLG
ncbi:23S rRNA (guanosine(2251)-2'-O)-methyltransferase RlmB [Lentisalinibacter orientalis]|uniref:23S rRNA (guanosine(2251)-2'-O)-methyltransferase RlmB n=1 Tax=Lentisalinibacter orientalis TaxID=2992241 RepID=UPI00386D92CD